MLADTDKIGLILLAADRIARPINLIKREDGIAAEFYDLPLMPNLECRRPGDGEMEGH